MKPPWSLFPASTSCVQQYVGWASIISIYKTKKINHPEKEWKLLETLLLFLRTRGEQHHRGVVCSHTDKAWERECGRGSNRTNRAKSTEHTGGKSVSGKSLATRSEESQVQLETEQEEWQTHTHITETYTHFPFRHWHTLVIVTNTHQHMDRVLYTYMTSYLPEAYRLSIHYWRANPRINQFLIRLSIKTRCIDEHTS